jgi:hypothetical protein
MKRLCALIALTIILTPCLARAESVSVQAEDFFDSYNVELEAIRADGGALKGLDYAGEWADFYLQAPAFGTYAVTIRCWGDLNVPYHFHLVTLPLQGEDPQTIEFTYWGKGLCGS